jgi:repressor LexA
MLTKKQHELLMFIHERLKETGVSPSFDEMKEALDLASKSGIHRLITRWRSAASCAACPTAPARWRWCACPNRPPPRPGAGPPAFSPRVVENTPRRHGLPAAANDVRDLPILGRIAAGTPIEAIQHERERIQMPRPCWAPASTTCSSPGRLDDQRGILDGDLVVIKKTDSANSGRSSWLS